MRQSGTLRTWHEDRGFGFIAPRDGGRELFVHISAFPRDGSRPVVGETLYFELGPGRDGKAQAVRVQRRALGEAQSLAAARARPLPRRGGGQRVLGPLVLVLLLAVAGSYGYRRFIGAAPDPAPVLAAPPMPARAEPAAPAAPAFRCDGRTHCSQMHSCAEAKFFLQHCPDVKMDGDGDGTPCARQWCTGPHAP